MPHAKEITRARAVSVIDARRLALSAQGLDAGSGGAGTYGRKGARRGIVDRARLVEMVQRLGYVQLDPISVVARSPLLVLWSRLGPFEESLLEDALYGTKELFEYWAHAAAIVPTSEYASFKPRMRSFATWGSTWADRIRLFMATNSAVVDEILAELARSGPLPAQAFGSHAPVTWETGGWTLGGTLTES